MSNFSRFAIAAVLVGGLGGAAQAQSQSPRWQTAADRTKALSEGRSGFVDRSPSTSDVTLPSESQTVMGLRVPR